MSTPEGPQIPPQGEPVPPTPPQYPPQPAAAAPPGAALVVPNASGPPHPPYAVQVQIGYPEQLSRWLPFVKWLLAIPHFIVLYLLRIGALFVVVFAFFAVLFTGRYPQGAFDFLTGYYRWGTRVGAYILLLTDAYPPFSLDDDPAYPVRLTIDYPAQGIARWRPLVQWLLVIPAGIGAALLGLGALVAYIVGWFAVVFTRRFPRGLFELVVVALRWQARVNAYTDFMTEQYPPFVYG